MSQHPGESEAEYERRCIAMDDEAYARELRELLAEVEPIVRECRKANAIIRKVLETDPRLKGGLG